MVFKIVFEFPEKEPKRSVLIVLLASLIALWLLIHLLAADITVFDNYNEILRYLAAVLFLFFLTFSLRLLARFVLLAMSMKNENLEEFYRDIKRRFGVSDGRV